MLGDKRSSLEIVQEIMLLATSGQRKTRIMYGANLSYEMLVTYLEFLDSRGFIRIDSESGKITVTDAGQEFLGDVKRVTRHFRRPILQ